MSNDNLIKELNDTLTNISVDIRHIMTTLNHFDGKFKDTQKDIEGIRKEASESQKVVQQLRLDVNTTKNDNDDVKKDVEILFDKFRQRDKKSDNDRKWIIGTVISVVVMFVGLAGLAISLIGG